MKTPNVFKRREIKYLITDLQKEALMRFVLQNMHPDEFGKSTIRNVYFDTPDFKLISNSLEHPLYKEKLRLRSYCKANQSTPAFVEIKKKYNGIVYKRRVQMPLAQANDFLGGGIPVDRNQITNEIEFFLRRYPLLMPQVLITYNREAFFENGNSDFRITFDDNILWRDYDVSLCKDIYGNGILQPGMNLMEVKTAGALPLWLVGFLSENGIFKTSFSKYGNAYVQIHSGLIKEINANLYKGELLYA